jgi:hypothetical protein
VLRGAIGLVYNQVKVMVRAVPIRWRAGGLAGVANM